MGWVWVGPGFDKKIRSIALAVVFRMLICVIGEKKQPCMSEAGLHKLWAAHINCIRLWSGLETKNRISVVFWSGWVTFLSRSDGFRQKNAAEALLQCKSTENSLWSHTKQHIGTHTVTHECAQKYTKNILTGKPSKWKFTHPYPCTHRRRTS